MPKLTRHTRRERRASDLRALLAIQTGATRDAAASAEGISRVQLWRRIKQLSAEVLGPDGTTLCARRRNAG